MTNPAFTHSPQTIVEPFVEYHKHTPKHVDNVPNHHHPHRPNLHDDNMAPPSAIDAHRVANNTHNYRILNAMEYPALFGVQQRTMPKTSLFIDRVLDNVSNYALAYPMAGENVVERPYGVQVQTKKGMFYAGKDQSLGSNYFVPLGVCGDESEAQCKGKPKMVYIRNIPTGRVPLLGNISMDSLTGCNIEGITNGKGLVPGMLEDISDIADFGGPNSVGEKCRRIRLPVGTHIYDSKMKCELDYTKIDNKQTLESRHQETLRQVRDNCPNNSGINNKTWWYEEHCSPSFNNCSKVDDLKGSIENKEGTCIPKAKPSFYVPGTEKPSDPHEPKIKSIPETFQARTNPNDSNHPKDNTNINSKTRYHSHLQLLLAITVACLVCYVVWLMYR